MATTKSILFVDAYDSFSQNIAALLDQELGVHVSLIKIDADIQSTTGLALERFIDRFDAIVLGPGPGNPNDPKDVGILYSIFDAAAATSKPILGICLGFQALCIKYGLRIDRMREPCHGQPKKVSLVVNHASKVNHDEIFDDIDTDNIWATCYNSLGLSLANTLPSSQSSRPGSSGTNASVSTTSSQASASPGSNFRVLAVDDHDYVMAIRHRYLPFWGVQFHPESCKSNAACRQLVRNWWLAVQRRNQMTDESIHKDSIPAKLCDRVHENQHSDSDLTVDEHITARLVNACVTTGNRVEWRKISVTSHRMQVSELMNDMATKGFVAMLESTKKGRFSVYAAMSNELFHSSRQNTKPLTPWHIEYSGGLFSLLVDNVQQECSITASTEIVWKAVESLIVHKRATGGPEEVPFWGGFVGFLSYEHGLDTLGVKSQGNSNRQVPDISLAWVERSIVYDHHTNSVYIQSIRQQDQAFVDGMAALLSSPSKYWSRSKTQSTQMASDLQLALTAARFQLPDHHEYNSKFHQCQEELRAGNSYELCLTTEASISIPKPQTNSHYEFELYKNLHAHNPVPFGAFLKLGNITILGTSPEQYMSWSRSGTIDMIPMKGTVKRSASMTFARASEILSSPKESAENLMIADLIRHDLYSALGHTSQVNVVKLCEVVEHETVYQLVSHIRARAPITPGASADETQKQTIHYGLRTLQQTVPPGSMTGAPKKRSCEILAGLEQRNRGLYSGVLGYMDVGGGGNWNVCIRTAFRCDGESDDQTEGSAAESRDVWHLGAGGAITVLSDAEGEWQEMMVKLNSVLQGFRTVKTAQYQE